MKKIIWLIPLLMTVLFSCNKNLSPRDLSKANDTCRLKPVFAEYTKISGINISKTNNALVIKNIQNNFLVIPSQTDYTGEEVFLKQIRIKSPSEHSLNGKHFPLEIQFIHLDTSKNLVILSLFVEQKNSSNVNIQKILNIYNKQKDTIDLYELTNVRPSYFFYKGDYPELKKTARWFVLTTPIFASKQQIDEMQKIIGKHPVKQSVAIVNICKF